MGTRTMFDTTRAACAALTAALLALGACAQTPTAGAASTTGVGSPGSGFADPQGIPARPAADDIEPVYRGPAVDTLATVLRRGALRIGVAVNAPMVMRTADGGYTGYAIDLGRKLADDLGVQPVFVETAWSQIVRDAVENQFDVVASGMWVTPARALVLNFTEQTASEGIYLMASQQAAPGRHTRADFDRPDARIVVYGGSAQERIAAREFPKATIVKVVGDDDHLSPVLLGQADAALIPTVSPQQVVNESEGRLYLPLAEPLSSTYTAFAVRKGDADWLSYLNTWIALQRQDGWLADRAAYWAEPGHWPRP